MKKIVSLLILILLSCDNNNNSLESNIDNEKDLLEKNYETAESLLEFDAEKVALISVIKGISQEKTKSVLKDYLASTLGIQSLFKMDDSNRTLKLIDSIANKNGISDKLTASIIFTFKYEMITKDEIIQEYASDTEY